MTDTTHHANGADPVSATRAVTEALERLRQSGQLPEQGNDPETDLQVYIHQVAEHIHSTAVKPTTVDEVEHTLGMKGEMPYILESANFERLIAVRRAQAERIIEDLDADIERFELEIQERKRRRADLLKIVVRADAAMAALPE